MHHTDTIWGAITDVAHPVNKTYLPTMSYIERVTYLLLVINVCCSYGLNAYRENDLMEEEEAGAGDKQDECPLSCRGPPGLPGIPGPPGRPAPPEDVLLSHMRKPRLPPAPPPVPVGGARIRRRRASPELEKEEFLSAPEYWPPVGAGRPGLPGLPGSDGKPGYKGKHGTKGDKGERGETGSGAPGVLVLEEVSVLTTIDLEEGALVYTKASHQLWLRTEDGWTQVKLGPKL